MLKVILPWLLRHRRCLLYLCLAVLLVSLLAATSMLFGNHSQGSVIERLVGQYIEERHPKHVHQEIAVTQTPTLTSTTAQFKFDESVGRQKFTGPTNERQVAVVAALRHAWTGYSRYAWGHDELKPISKGWYDWFKVGLTIVDSLDSLWIMGLHEEFAVARDWVAKDLNYHDANPVLMFEIVIRELGGLLSAFHLSKDDIFLKRAVELGDGLLPCLAGPKGIPCRTMYLAARRPNFEDISVAEIGTIQLEFRELSRVTGDAKYEVAVESVSSVLHNMKKVEGLLPAIISILTGEPRMDTALTAGASADSYYEYLLKQWIQTGKTRDSLRDDYLAAIDGIQKILLHYSVPSKFAFVGSLFHAFDQGNFRSEMEHLACFLPGTLALGYMHGLGGKTHLDLARELTRSCVHMYLHMETKLSPESAVFNQKEGSERPEISVTPGQYHNLQRPETVESLFYLYRATKDPQYRDWGWEIFQAFENHTRVENGYVSIGNVRNPQEPVPRDKMETFYLAETLKYLYLLFSDDPDLIRLDQYVINTEAHPLPVHPN